MADEYERRQLNRERQPVVRRKASEFQEVPGESEAEAARDSFLKRAGTDPGSVASALSKADGATRAQAINRLQEERGNAYVQRVVAEAHGAPGRLVGLPQSEMVEEVTQRKGSGSPIPEGTRQQMQGFFGSDLGEVRVHSDGEASSLNRELNAEAFTVGNDVFFGAGKYQPGSSEGQGLLAHELAHVGQQTGFGQSAQREGNEEDELQAQRQAVPEEEEETAQQ